MRAFTYERTADARGAVAAVEQDVEDVREFMSGNICRCAAYPNIVAAIDQVRRADATV